MSQIPTVPVAPAAIRPGHMMRVDGLYVKALTRAKRYSSGSWRISWIAVSDVPPGADDMGILHAQSGDAVPCMRRADVLALLGHTSPIPRLIELWERNAES